MAKKGPGKAYREGISLKKLMRMFPDDDKAREWIEKQIWSKGPHCPHCGSFNVQTPIKHKTMTHRCRDCPKRPQFSLKTGTVMQASNLGYQVWATAIYLLSTNLKGVSAMKLHRDLEIAYTSAWHLAHRLRQSYSDDVAIFAGPTEADEVYMGGKEKNKHSRKKTRKGRGAVGKTAVAGIKDRATNQVRAKVIKDTDAKTLQGFVSDHTEDGSTVYTDDATAYKGLKKRRHETVKHSVGEYVNGMASTQGIESFWAMLKRGYHGTFHHFSEKHMDRYVTEFAGRHNIRRADTVDQMAITAKRMAGKRLRYRDLVA